MKQSEYERLIKDNTLARGLAFDTLPSKDETIDDKIYNLATDNRRLYDDLRKKAEGKGNGNGHIALYEEILNRKYDPVTGARVDTLPVYIG